MTRSAAPPPWSDGSPPPTRRRLSAAARRALVLEAAGRLFADRGFDGTRVADIATAAGVTKPVLYRHFDDKTALYLAVLERHRHDLGGFAGAVPVGGSREARIRGLLDLWLTYVEAHAYAWRLLFRDTGGGSTIARSRSEVHQRARSVIAELIDQLVDGEIPADELEPLAELMRMGMASLVLWWIDDPSAPRAAVLSAMERVWLGLLAPPESAGGSAREQRA